MAERRLFNLILSCYLMDGGGTDGGRSVVEVLVNNKDRMDDQINFPESGIRFER
jgi:hypothetical protein